MCLLCDAGNKSVRKSVITILDPSDSKVKTMTVSGDFKDKLLEACRRRNNMRYLFQILTMLADITFFIVMALILRIAFQAGVLIGAIWLALMISAIRIWIRQGGFMAWKPSEIKKFMTNAKRMGL